MEDQPSKPPKLVEVTRVVEFVAKYSAVFGMAALATAFIYDSIFWSVADRRVLGYFVLSDHIETAVQVIVILVVLLALSIGMALLVQGYAYLHKLIQQRYLHIYLPGMLLIGWLCIVYGVSRIAGWLPSVWSPEAQETADVVALLVVLFAMPALFSLPPLFRREGKSYAEGWRQMLEKPLVPGAVLWLMATCAVAIILGLSIKDPGASGPPMMTRDVVVIENDAELTGVVIRVLDKGVVLLDLKDRRILFIPKERVRRLDLGVPLAAHR